MMKVAHILSYYPGQEGLTSFCRGLGKALKNLDGVEVPIVTFRRKPPRVEEPEDGPVVLKYPHQGRHPFAIPQSFLDDLDDGSLVLDGAVLHGTYSPQVCAQARALRRRGIPYIFMPHDPYVKKLRRHHAIRKFVYWHLFEKPMIEGAAAVQILDEEHEHYLRELGCKVPTFVESNGCDPAALALLPATPHTPGSRDRLQLHFLGRMDRNHKGLDLLIEAFSRLPSSWKVELVLTGNDWFDRGELENLARKLGIQDRVNFRGRRPEPSILLQAEADLCVLTSRFDGFGLTIVEGMLASRPVLVSTEAGISTHVERSGGGWTVKPTVDAIEQGLIDAIKGKSRWEEFGKRNHRYVLENLTWEKVARNSLKHYERVFGKV
jgi:glycosyltransferase involved in cell wall biosynthesis